MKRYPSIDFMRGLAIFIMIFIHTLMRFYDRKIIMDNMAAQPIILLVLLIFFLFLGGWCGFFLMVSAIGNMVSMYKSYEKKPNAGDLVLKQVIGGFILLAFAILTESTTGYNAMLGHLAEGDPNWLTYLLYHGYHFETIHAVAWCIILNGLVQGLLSMKGGFYKIRRNIKIYIILAIGVVAATPLVYSVFNYFYPPIYAHSITATGYPAQYIVLGKSSIWQIFYKFWLLPWASQLEPVFPFLAVSFIGSIIGLYVMDKGQSKEKVSTKPLKRGMLIAFIMCIAGLLGTVYILFFGGFDIGQFLGNTFDVTNLQPDGLWFWWFMLLTGSQMGAVLLVFRLVEFRGGAESFGKKSLYFRRFGFVAFSIYNWQFLDLLAAIPLGLLPWFPSYSFATRNSWNSVQIWFLIIAVLILWQPVLKLWEKTNFTFSMEWFIAKIADKVIPSKRRLAKENQVKGWWRTRRLDVKSSLYTPEWINIINKSDIDHSVLTESKLAFKLALTGLIFFPNFFIAINLARKSVTVEQKNKYNTRAKWIGIIGGIIIVAIIVALSVTRGLSF